MKKSNIIDKFYVFGGEDQRRPATTNICLYIRGTVFGLMKFLWYILAGTAIGMFTVYPWFVGVMTLVTGQFLPQLTGEGLDVIFIISAGVQALFLVLFIIFVVHERYLEYKYYREYISEARPPKEPWITTLWYRSIREKTCFTVERT